VDAAFGDGWNWYALDGSNGGADVGVRAAWGSWNKKLVYVVAADGTASSATRITTTGAGTEYAVELNWPNGRTDGVRVETADGRTGRAVHAGRSYDLGQGSVLVLLARGDQIELRQLRRDLSGVTPHLAGVQKFIREDSELLRTFASEK
jgi:hypothetical protein